MDSHTSRAVAVMLAGALGVAGCGGGTKEAPGDAGGALADTGGAHGNTPPDAGQSDASEDGGAEDSAVNCGMTAPTGTQIVASVSPLVLEGGHLTSDGYAFYEDQNSQVVYAVSVDGGAPANLGTITSQFSTFWVNGGKAALFLTAAAGSTTNLAPLSAWTAATGANAISTSAFAYDSYYYTYDVSIDGTSVAYFASTDSMTATLTVSGTDGKSQQNLVPDIDLTNQNCSPMLQFVNDTLVAYYCLVPGAGGDDAGADAAVVIPGGLTIASFAGPKFAQTTLTTLAVPTADTSLYGPVPVSADGTELLVPTNGLSIYPIAGGSPATVDPNGATGFFTPEGNVVYATVDGALMRYEGTDAGTPVTLLGSDVDGLLTISPDGRWVQFADNEGNDGYDVLLASSATPGPAIPELSAATGNPIGFSADSLYETFQTNMPQNFGIDTFDMNTSPVDGGAATKLVSSAGTWAFTTGSKVVINVNPNLATGSSDIEAFDLANPGTSQTLVTQADPNFFYAGASNQIVYTWHCLPNGSSGVWTVAAP